MQLEKKPNTRTLTQNRAMHKYFQLLSDALNDAGFGVQAVLKPGINVSWSPTTVKELLWKTVLKAYKMKDSTTKMSTTDIDRVYDIVNQHVGETTGVFIPWPEREKPE